jgi:hypothetical protein
VNYLLFFLFCSWIPFSFCWFSLNSFYLIISYCAFSCFIYVSLSFNKRNCSSSLIIAWLTLLSTILCSFCSKVFFWIYCTPFWFDCCYNYFWFTLLILASFCQTHTAFGFYLFALLNIYALHFPSILVLCLRFCIFAYCIVF